MIAFDEMSNDPFRFRLSLESETKTESVEHPPHESVGESKSELCSRTEGRKRHPERVEQSDCEGEISAPANVMTVSEAFRVRSAPVLTLTGTNRNS